MDINKIKKLILKNRFYIAVAVVALVLVIVLSCIIASCGDSNTTMAIVGEEKITQSDITNRIEYNDIYNETLKEVMGNRYNEKDFAVYALPTDEKEVTELLIEGAVIRKTLGDRAKSFEEISKTVSSELNYEKENNDINYVATLDELEQRKIKYEKYVELCNHYFYDFYNRQVLRQEFLENVYVNNDNSNFDEQFEVYVDGLVNKEKIERK